MTARPMERPTKVRDVFRPHCARTCPCSPAFAVNPERGLLEEAGRAVLTWDAAWDQWTPQRQVHQWLTRLTGTASFAVAAPRSRPLQYGPAGSGSVSHCSNISDRPPRAAGEA